MLVKAHEIEHQAEIQETIPLLPQCLHSKTLLKVIQQRQVQLSSASS